MSQLQIQHHYQLLSSGQRLHYLSCGLTDKPAVVLLHPSPMSSSFMRPVMEALADRAYVIAPDTPGYGLSEPLTNDTPGLAPYVAALADFLSAINVQMPVLYGSSTGAQIALEFGKAHPQQLSGLILDNAAHFEDQERTLILRQYFPKRTPVEDGAHLANHWLGVRNLSAFFPWFEETSQARLKTDLSPIEVIQAQLLDQLRAGKAYSRAYRAAFENEDIANVLPVKVNTCIVRWQGSILWPWTQALAKVDWPGHIQLMDAGPTSADRMQTIQAAYKRLVNEHQPYTAVTLSFSERLMQAGAGWSDTREAAKALHWRGQANQKTCLLLHDLGASAACFAPLLKNQPGVMAVDLPGHGASGASVLDIESAAEQIADDLQALHITRLQIVAIGLGAAVGAKLISLVKRCDHFLAIDAKPPAPLPDMTLKWGGGHLLEVWYALKDRQRYSPWHQRTLANRLELRAPVDLDELQEELLYMLTARESASIWHEQLRRFDWTSAWASVRRQTALHQAHWRTKPNAEVNTEVNAEDAEVNAEDAEVNAKAKVLPTTIKLWAEPLASYLDSRS